MQWQNKNKLPKFASYQPGSSAKGKLSAVAERANRWLHQHPKSSLIALILLVVAVGGSLSYRLATTRFDNSNTVLTSKEQKFYSLLTGLEISQEDSKRPVTAVMIENSPDARPQSGLKEAGLVFESVAEGGITRFLVLYHEAKPKIIGPVRSIRPQFASWVAAYDAGVAHVGGSDIPLKKLRSGQIKDLDQFFSPEAYERVAGRFPPHNVYTSDSKLSALNIKKGFKSSNFTPWTRKRKAVKPKTKPTASAIAIPVSSGLFEVSYRWNSKTNTYTRSQGGGSHSDREKGQITPTVVIAMQVPHDVIRDSNNYRYPQVIGSGKAWLFQDGKVTNLKWSKKSDKSMIAYQTNDGKAVKLNPGQTWITAIAKDKAPSWR